MSIKWLIRAEGALTQGNQEDETGGLILICLYAWTDIDVV